MKNFARFVVSFAVMSMVVTPTTLNVYAQSSPISTYTATYTNGAVNIIQIATNKSFVCQSMLVALLRD